MTINASPSAPPLFLGIPLLNSGADTSPGALQAGTSPAVGQIVATSQQHLIHRIYQMDPTAIWLGSLGASDLTTERIVAGLYYGSTLTSFKIDTILLLNHNLTNFVIEYCNDYVPGTGGAAGTSAGGWINLATVTGQAAADYQLFLNSPITANALRITMTNTSPSNLNKQLGSLIAALSIFQASKPMMKLGQKAVQTKVDARMADKTLDRTYYQWSDNSFVLYTLAPEFEYMTPADKANFDALLALGAPFLYYPEPGDVPRSIFLVVPAEGGGYEPEYLTQFKGAGYKFSFPMQQVGFL